MKRFPRILACCLCLIMLPWSALGETVVTSFYPIWLLALNLCDGIPALEVHNLAMPDTGCLHDYQLQTGDMKVLATADLFLINGAGMESYLDLVTSAFPDLPIGDASEGIPLLLDGGALQIGEAEEDAKEEGINAHLWLSARNAVHMAENLSSALQLRFPAYEKQLQANLRSFSDRLLALDEALLSGLSDLPRKDIVTFHEAFPYFAQSYGLNVVAVVNREPGETLSPTQLAQLVDVIRALDLPPLFVEPQYEELSARTLAAETGAKVFTLDPIVTGPGENVSLDYYEQRMLQNMRTLQEALGSAD